MIENSQKHLVLFLDIRNCIYKCEVERDSLYMDILKQHSVAIFEREASSHDYFSIVVPSNEEASMVSFMFSRVKIRKITQEDIRNTVEFLKYRFRFERDDIDYPDFKQFVRSMVGTLLQAESLHESYFKLVMLLNAENMIKIEAHKEWSFSEFNRNRFSIGVEFFDTRVFGFDFKLGMARYKPQMRLQLVSNELSVNSDLFEQDYLPNDSSFVFEQIERPERAAEFRHTFQSPMTVFVKLKVTRGWILIDKTEEEYLFKMSKDKSLICKIKQVDQQTTVSYRNASEDTLGFVDRCVEEDSLVVSLARHRPVIEEELLGVLCCDKALLSAFESRFFYFLIEDFVSKERRRETFDHITKILKGKGNSAVCQGRFFQSLPLFNVVCEVAKLSRNFFVLKATLLSLDFHRHYPAFAALFHSLKASFESELTQATIIDKSIMKIVKVRQCTTVGPESSHKGEFYQFEDFNYFICSSSDHGFDIQKHSLMSCRMGLSVFYKKFMVAVLSLKLTNKQYKPLVNANDHERVVYFLKVLSAHPVQKSANKKALSILKLTLPGPKAPTLKLEWRIMVPNPFLPLDPSYMETVKSEYCKLTKFVDRFTVPLKVYFRILMSIEADTRRDNELRRKESLYSIKYNFCLMYFSEKAKRRSQLRRNNHILSEMKKKLRKKKVSNAEFLGHLKTLDLGEQSQSQLVSEIDAFSVQKNLTFSSFLKEASQLYSEEALSTVNLLKQLKDFAVEKLKKYAFRDRLDDSLADSFDLLVDAKQQVELEVLHFQDNARNAELFKDYLKMLASFCELTLPFAGDRALYFKLFRPKVFAVYQCLLNGQAGTIELRFSFMCLKCLADQLKRKSCLVSDSELPKRCKYHSLTYSRATSKCKDNVERLLKLIFMISLNQETTAKYLLLSVNRNNTFTSRTTFKYDLTELLRLMRAAQAEGSSQLPRIMETFTQMLTQLFDLFFLSGSEPTANGDFEYFSFKNPEPNSQVDILNRISSQQGTVPQHIQHLVVDFLRFLNLNFDQIRMVRLQFLLTSKQRKKKRSFSSIPQMFSVLSDFDPAERVQLDIKEYMPNFERIANFFEGQNKDEAIKALRGSAHTKDNYFQTVLVYVFNFVSELASKFREKMENSIHNLLRVALSAFSFEFMFLCPVDFPKFPVSLLERLERCCKTQELLGDFAGLQTELEEAEERGLCSEFFVERWSKRKQRDGQSRFRHLLAPKVQALNCFLSCEVRPDRVTLKSYKSLGYLTEQDKPECGQCLLYERLIESSRQPFRLLLRDVITQYYQHPTASPDSYCRKVCRTLRELVSLLYNQAFNRLAESMNNNDFIDEAHLYSANREEAYLREGQYAFPVHEERIVIANFAEWSFEIFHWFHKKFSKNFLNSQNLYLINTAAKFLCLIEINNLTNKDHSLDFVIGVRYFSEVHPDNLAVYSQILQVIRQTIDAEIIKSIKTTISKTNEICRYPFVMTFVTEILKECKIVIRVPLVAVGVLTFYLSKIMEKNFKKVKSLNRQERGVSRLDSAGSLVVNGVARQLEMHRVEFVSEDYTYIKIDSEDGGSALGDSDGLGTNDRDTEEVKEGLFFFEHDVRSMVMVNMEELSTRDNSSLFGMLNEGEDDPRLWAFNDFISPDDLQIDLGFFRRRLRCFAVERIETSEPNQPFSPGEKNNSNHKQKGVPSEPQDPNPQDSQDPPHPQDPPQPKDRVKPHSPKSSKPPKRLSPDCSALRTISFNMNCNCSPSDLYKFRSNLLQMLRFAFHEYFLEMAFSAHMLRTKAVPVLRSFQRFSEVLNEMFKKGESRPVSLKQKAFENRSYLIYLFHYFLQLASLLTQTFGKCCGPFKAVFHCDNLDHLSKMREKQRRQSVRKNTPRPDAPEGPDLIDCSFADVSRFKEWMSANFQNRKNLFMKNELRFSLTFVPEEMCFDDVSEEHKDTPVEGQNFEEKYEKVLMVGANCLQLEGGRRAVFPPRRFFVKCNFKYKEIELLSYNINDKTTKKLHKTVNRFNYSVGLKRELFEFTAMQKLGFHYKTESIKTVDPKNARLDKYDPFIAKVHQLFPQRRIRHYTDVVTFLLSSSLEDDLVSTIMKEKNLKARLVHDFYNLQFFFLDNVNCDSLRLVSLQEVG
jgi:hypothetical protein